MKTASRARPPAAAFSLLELLTVIALIAILAAMLFPVFARAREKARQSTCAAHLRQIGMAYQMYTTDYDGVYPWAITFAAKKSGDYPEFDQIPTLPEILQPYCHSLAIFGCPSDSGLPDVDALPTRFDALQTSYAFDIGLRKHSESEINAARHFVAGDQSLPWHSGFADPNYFDKRGNVLFADGHVKFLFNNQVSDLFYPF